MDEETEDRDTKVLAMCFRHLVAYLTTLPFAGRVHLSLWRLKMSQLGQGPVTHRGQRPSKRSLKGLLRFPCLVKRHALEAITSFHFFFSSAVIVWECDTLGYDNHLATIR